MDIDECKIGYLPNVAIDPRTGLHAATGEPVEYPPVQGEGLRTAVYDYERYTAALETRLKALEAEYSRLADENLHLQDALRHKQKVCDIQRDSFRKMEVEITALRHLALGMWRSMDAMRMAGRAPEQVQLDGWAKGLAARGIEAE